MRWLHLLAAVALVAAAGVATGACGWILPEGFAVNAPIAHMLFGRGIDAPSEEAVESRLKVPRGLSIGLWAEGLPNARFLRPTAAGDLLVSTPRSGQVWLVERDLNGDGRSDGQRVLLGDLVSPHGLDFLGDTLYVAEGDGIGRVPFDAEGRTTTGAYERVVDGLPTGGNHWTRTVRFGPDGLMYVSVGSSCNVCEEEDPRRAAILRFRPDGSGAEIYATGLRNAVGFDWQPGTGALYATDNGRDLLGDDSPPCELNEVVQGGFYGWPYALADASPDPDYGDLRPDLVRATRPAAHPFRAHNAPLGITFVRGEQAPPSLRGAALVALHGSWNRTRKDGYKVVSLHWSPDGRITERDFATGFFDASDDGDVIGRPVDVAEGPDGSFYVSDDYAGVIYRIAAGAAPSARPAGPSAPAADPLAGLPPAEQAEAAARGRDLYARLDCASCHEVERAPPGVVPVRLQALSARYTIDGLSAYLAVPTPPMPVPAADASGRRALAIHLLDRFR